MSNSEILAIYPDASIRIIRLSEAVTSAELFLWPAGTAGISAIGADRHEALQRLEKQMRGLADAVSGTFTQEVRSDE